MTERLFWMVWSPEGRAPTCKHPTQRAADTEAERLARAHRGQSFYVLQAMSVSKAVDVVRIELESDPYSNDPNVPF